MNSDEERLEEMLKAVMETESAIAAEQEEEIDIPEMSDLMDEMPELSEDELKDLSLDELPEDELLDLSLDEMPEDELLELSKDKMSDASLDEMPEQAADESLDAVVDEMPEQAEDESSDLLQGEIPEQSEDGVSELPQEEIPEQAPADKQSDVSMEMPGVPSEEPHKQAEDEMMVDPLDFLTMSEEEIDQVLEKETALEEEASGKKDVAAQENKDVREPSNVEDDLSDIEQLLQMAENHEQVAESAPKTGRKLPDIPEEEDSEEEPKKSEKKKKEKKEKKKKEKKKDKNKDGGSEKEGGLGKKLAAIFFGSDEDELDEENQAAIAGGEQSNAAADEKKGAGAKEKKKKEKKQPKKSGPDPKKAEKEKLKKAKNAEKAKKKAEKALKAEAAAKEKRAEKKLPKKKVIVWVILCASVGIGILLINTIGMTTLQLTEARNSFDNKDFETAYRLLNGKELSEEDQLLFVQASAVLHLQHAEEAYENHLKLEKLTMALDDLLRGVDKYQELLQLGNSDMITPEATQHYQNILRILQENYSLSEAGALEINAIESDYEYSLRIEALVNGEIYQSQTEIEEQQEDEAAKYPELEDMLPEEEEYFNDSSD